MRKRLLLTIALLLTLMAFALAGCGGQQSEQGGGKSTLEKARRQGYITVGFANEAPYAYMTTDGKLTGESVEVARVILRNLGIEEMKGVLTEFGALIQGLQAGRFDMVTAGMAILPQRAEQVDFANPDYKVGVAIAVAADNPLDLYSYEDIAANPKVKVAAIAGGMEIGFLRDIGVSEDQIVIVPDQPSAIEALQAGRVDVATMTGPALQTILDAKNDPSIERVADFEQPVIDGKSVISYGAAVFRKGDDEFREAYNAELEKLKESGELLEIIRPFGFTEENLPGDMTAEDVIQLMQE
ncbi:MAG: ectoine/hydroxyectoine ABC transporter substrate-binding protein EhuB [Clostridia bacterium]|nr:ectoine/hydroxyectoine ABC transporter substrate-binding protein EhuB [Clostridia bacterium]